MTGSLKVLAILLVLIYIMSPYDFLPDFLIPAGWLDDALLLGGLVYYLRRGRLPRIFSSLTGLFQNSKTRSAGSADRNDKSKTWKTEFDSNFNSKDKAGNPYKILGVNPGASDEEIRTAYHRAAQLYHPDKVSHLGPELQEVARRKFLEIQAAYDQLQNKAGR